MSAHEDAVDFINLVADADSSNRMEAIEDLKFVWGEQWPAQIQNSRTLENRPCLTINETESYVRHTENQIRQQRPRIKCHPVGSGADVQEAEIITGYIRHVEEISDASHAYDWASAMALRAGWGYWRINADYISEDSFDQDQSIAPIENIFSVYFDPNSTLPDGSDAEKCVITDRMSKTEFQRQFPDAEMSGFVKTAAGDVTAEWVGQHDIRLAELFEVEKKKAMLLALAGDQGGEPVSMFDDDFEMLQKKSPETVRAAGLKVVGSRQSHKRVVRWSKVSGFETLQSKVLPGRWIPVVPVYGGIMILEGKRKKFGMVKFAKDPARLNNFWQTAITESIALAPKAKWIMAVGQDEGYENEWAQANISARPILHYLPQTAYDKDVGPPQRLQPEPPPEGAMVAAMGASQMLQRVMGMFDPAVRGGAQRKSDKTLNAEAQQSELSNFHFYDNLTRSQKHTGRILLNRMPILIDTPNRLQRIIGEDDRPKMVTLNQTHDKQGMALQKVLHDVRVGQWDVIMETGPGYNSKRQEGLVTFMQMLDTPLGEIMAKTAPDLIMRLVDVSGAQAIADRMAAATPGAQDDKELEDMPPKAQQMIQGLRQQIQQMGQELQKAGIEIKFGLQKEQMKQDAETKRALLKETTKAHDVEMIAATKRHDTEVRAQSVMSAAEIKAMTDLMLKHIDTAQLREEIEARNAEQNAKEAEHESPST